MPELKSNSETINRIIIATSITFYLLGCLMPAITFDEYVWQGYNALLYGALGFLIGQFAWAANPLYLGSIVALAWKNWKWATLLSALALLCSADTLDLFWHGIPRNGNSLNVRDPASSLDWGFFLWVGSMAVVFIPASLFWHRQRRSNRSESK